MNSKFLESLAYWNDWRGFVRDARAAHGLARDGFCHAAMIAYAEHLMLQAEYWKGVRP